MGIFHELRLFLSDQKIWCPATMVAKCLCYHSCRMFFDILQLW